MRLLVSIWKSDEDRVRNQSLKRLIRVDSLTLSWWWITSDRKEGNTKKEKTEILANLVSSVVVCLERFLSSSVLVKKTQKEGSRWMRKKDGQLQWNESQCMVFVGITILMAIIYIIINTYIDGTFLKLARPWRKFVFFLIGMKEEFKVQTYSNPTDRLHDTRYNVMKTTICIL